MPKMENMAFHFPPIFDDGVLAWKKISPPSSVRLIHTDRIVSGCSVKEVLDQKWRARSEVRGILSKDGKGRPEDLTSALGSKEPAKEPVKKKGERSGCLLGEALAIGRKNCKKQKEIRGLQVPFLRDPTSP